MHDIMARLDLAEEITWEPMRLVVPGPWTGHLSFAFWLTKALRPRSFVELGTHTGNSYFAFCQGMAAYTASGRAYAVDTWAGDEHAGFYGNEVYSDVVAFNNQHFRQFSTLIRSTFDEARPYFAEGSIDLLHIDGMHSYEAVRHDFETWRPALSKRAVVVFHDTNVRERDFGVWRFWMEISGSHPSFEFAHSNGLGVLGVGTDLPPTLQSMFDMDPHEAGAFRRCIAARGEAFQRQVELLDTQSRLQGAEESAARGAAALATQPALQARVDVAEEKASQAAAAALLHTAEVSWRDALIAEQREVVAAKQAMAESLTQVAVGRREALGVRDRLIEERDRVAAQLQAQLSTDQHAIGEEQQARKDMQAGYEKQILLMNADRVHWDERLRAEITFWQAKATESAAWQTQLIAQAEAARARTMEIVAAFTTSTSWKVTRPLRRAMRLLRGRDDHGWLALTPPVAHPPPLPEPANLPASPVLPLPQPSEPPAVTGPPPLTLKQALREALRARLHAFLAGPVDLTLPFAEAPDVSIILVLHNQAELTLACLESIAQTLASAPFGVEIVIADNASTDETSSLLDRLNGVTILRNAQNLHFLKAVNFAAHQARGGTLLLLNNDAQLLPGSLASALAVLNHDETIGAVGGRIILPDGTLQEAGSIIWRDGACSGYCRGGDPASTDVMFQRDVDYCSGAFLLTRTETWRALGGFDEAFAPAYYEETDYCVRLWQRGLRVVYDPDSVILHFEFGSSASTEGALALQAINLAVFKAKHADWLAAQFPASPANVLAASASRSSRPRILVVDDRIPRPELGAGYPRAHRLLHELVEAGADVSLFPMYRHEETWPNVRRALDKRIEVLIRADRTQLNAFLRGRMGQFDAYLICRPLNMRWFLDALGSERHLLGGAAVIYDAEALFATRDLQKAEQVGQPIADAERHRMIAEEVSLTRLADTVVSVVAHEAAIFEDYGASNIRLLGHALDDQPIPIAWEDRNQVAFLGAIPDDATPNADAVAWFASEILPVLRTEMDQPELRLTVVGRVSSQRIEALSGSLLDLAGVADDLREGLGRVRVLVVPSRLAAGIPHKVHHAAALGIPMVVTALIAGQVGWQDGQELLVANDPASFARATAALFADQALWERLRSGALKRVRQDTSPERFRQTVQEIVAGISIVHRRAEMASPVPPPPPPKPTEPHTSRPAAVDWAVAVPFGTLPRSRMPRVGVIVHMFHTGIAQELRYYLENIPEADVYLSTDTEEKAAQLRSVFDAFERGKVDVRVTPNRGRDIAPKLIAFPDVYSSYELVLCLHSKVSNHATFLEPWRSYLFETLVGSGEIVRSIAEAFALLPDLGMVAPQHYESIRRWLGWNGNFEQASGLAQRMGLSLSPRRALDFPSGSMFWARPAALKPLLDLRLRFEDFPAECAQVDHTTAHAIERLFFYACERSGHTWLKVASRALMHDDRTVQEIATPAALSQFVGERGVMLSGTGEIAVLDNPAPMQTRIAPGLIRRLAARPF